MNYLLVCPRTEVFTTVRINWHIINYLLTGLLGLYLLFNTNWVQGPYQEIQAQGFHTARACVGCLENQGLVFPGTSRPPS